jgi:hypothetical protein
MDQPEPEAKSGQPGPPPGPGPTKAALLVDVPYLLEAAGALVLGTRSRPVIGCDFPALAEALATLVGGWPVGASLHASYWYDVSVPYPDTYQRALAGAPGVDIRLGGLLRGRPKGLDLRMARDMLLLGLQENVRTFHLLSWDRDLGEAVRDVQSMGAQVVLVTIPQVRVDGSQRLVPPHHLLLREADRELSLPTELLARHLFRRLPDTHGVFVIGPEPRPNRRRHLEDQALQVGYDLALQVAADSTPEELLALWRRGRDFGWTLPPSLEQRLLDAAATLPLAVRADGGFRIAVRSGFWAGIDPTLKRLAAAERERLPQADAIDPS